MTFQKIINPFWNIGKDRFFARVQILLTLKFTVMFKPCYSIVSYFSEKYNTYLTATFVRYNEEKSYAFIQNSGEKIWIEIDKINLLPKN